MKVITTVAMSTKLIGPDGENATYDVAGSKAILAPSWGESLLIDLSRRRRLLNPIAGGTYLPSSKSSRLLMWRDPADGTRYGRQPDTF
jgi:hypothetical protein